MQKSETCHDFPIVTGQGPEQHDVLFKLPVF